MHEPDSSQVPTQQSSVSLSKNGDAIEQEWWPKLQPYISKYETLWQMHVEPLRRRDSIYFRRRDKPKLSESELLIRSKTSAPFDDRAKTEAIPRGLNPSLETFE